MKNALKIAVVSVAALLTLGPIYPTQKAEAQSGRRTAKRAHHDRLWAWLQRFDYTKWNSADGQAPEFQPSESPHGALVKVYVSKRTASDVKHPPDGSVIVKENYRQDKKLMAVTVMQRSKGYDSQNGDWYYAKYMTDGTIVKTPPEMKSMPIAGKFTMCIECHSGADGDDFAFFND
jgi:hypothetical protein